MQGNGTKTVLHHYFVGSFVQKIVEFPKAAQSIRGDFFGIICVYGHNFQDRLCHRQGCLEFYDLFAEISHDGFW